MFAERVLRSGGKNVTPSHKTEGPDGGLEVGAWRSAPLAIEDAGADDDDQHEGADDGGGLETICLFVNCYILQFLCLFLILYTCFSMY